VPQSRHRKINKARKRPRVASTNPSAITSSEKAISNRNLRIGAIILIVVLAAAGIAYLVTNRGTQAVLSETTTASGLKIQDLRIGDGATPQMGQRISVHYIGWLENGTEFNNSYKLNSPAEFKLGEVIEGWNEGLATMKVGGKRRLIIPSNLAYGARGRPPAIPPNSNLTFEIELLGIK
jgi:peptidylprolyl isomerase